MNLTLGTGRSVHARRLTTTGTPKCREMGTVADGTFQSTTDLVTCKRCTKILADEKEARQRTEYYAGVAEAEEASHDYSYGTPKKVIRWDAPAFETAPAETADEDAVSEALNDPAVLDALHAEALAEDAERTADELVAGMSPEVVALVAAKLAAKARAKTLADEKPTTRLELSPDGAPYWAVRNGRGRLFGYVVDRSYYNKPGWSVQDGNCNPILAPYMNRNDAVRALARHLGVMGPVTVAYAV